MDELNCKKEVIKFKEYIGKKAINKIDKSEYLIRFINCEEEPINSNQFKVFVSASPLKEELKHQRLLTEISIFLSQFSVE